MIWGVVLLSLFGVCHAEGDNAWQWIRVSEKATFNPVGWDTFKGTATVRIDGRHIRIEAFDAMGSVEPTIIIEGTIDSKGRIIAKGTRTHTDEGLFDLKGSMRTWTEDYKDIRTEYREIVFPLHPYHEFYGLLTSTTRKR